MQYREYSTGDFDQLYSIEESCFAPLLRFDRRYMRRLIATNNSATWIAEESRRLAGFAIVEWAEDSGAMVAYIQTIEVAPEQRGKGVARGLMRRIECSSIDAGAGLLWLHVSEENAPAIRMYESLGFSAQGGEENYYPDGHAALVYAKRLAV